ncbi:hypothetical protein BDN72DRAFT_431092 [Pluteus cervinus]|uniref:Uncharacterized protein n=1 Tax=Pluteus cervinus TaxID=181527 RepID=A0ACD3A770_9AGAR|nr:hypothetical protein BDN72DRAFT_431092 [Pluteus cervinus]
MVRPSQHNIVAIDSLNSHPIYIVLDILGDRLEVLVCNLFESREDGGPSLPTLDRRADSIAEDNPRIVILWYGTDSVRTWYEGVRGGLGMWRIADEAVQVCLARARTVAT